MLLDTGALASDVGCLIIPFGTGGGVGVRLAAEGVEQVTKVGVKSVVKVGVKGSQILYNELSDDDGGYSGSSGNSSGADNASSGGRSYDPKKMQEKEIADFFDDPNWHKTSAKKDFLKPFSKQLKVSTNADFYIDILLQGNKSKDLIPTGDFF